MSYPAWNDSPTTPAFQDNVPVWPPTQPTDPNAGTVPGTGKIGIPVYKICEQSDVDNYLVKSLQASGLQTGQYFEDYAGDYYPVTWGAETRRGWIIPMPSLTPPGAFWSLSVHCKPLLGMMMARGVGAPGYWRYEPNNIFAMMTSSGLVWYFM